MTDETIASSNITNFPTNLNLREVNDLSQLRKQEEENADPSRNSSINVIKFKSEQIESDSDISGIPRVNKRNDCTRKRKIFCLNEKFTALERIRNGESRPKVCREMRLAESTLRGWIKAEEALRKSSEKSVKAEIEIKMEEDLQSIELDSLLYGWYVNELNSGNNVSDELLHIEAEKLYLSLNPGKCCFAFRTRFIREFMISHGLLPVDLSGKSSRKSPDSNLSERTSDCSVKVNKAGDAPASTENCGSINAGIADLTTNPREQCEIIEKDTGESIGRKKVISTCRPALKSQFNRLSKCTIHCKEKRKTKPMKRSLKMLKPISVDELPSCSQVVFYLEESLRWFENESLSCANSNVEEIQNLLNYAKAKAQEQSQKKITDFFGCL